MAIQCCDVNIGYWVIYSFDIYILIFCSMGEFEAKFQNEKCNSFVKMEPKQL